MIAVDVFCLFVDLSSHLLVAVVVHLLVAVVVVGGGGGGGGAIIISACLLFVFTPPACFIYFPTQATNKQCLDLLFVC